MICPRFVAVYPLTVPIADAPTWAPGKSVVVYLGGATDHLRKAANLFKAGIKALDAGTLRAANDEIDASTYQLKRATTAVDGLQGFSCS